MSSSNFSRRKFLSGAATAGAASAMGIGAFTSCSGGGEKPGYPEFMILNPES